VVEASFVGVADVHAWAFADGFEAFEFIDLGGAIGGVGLGRLQVGIVQGILIGHGGGVW
jgi:hypothetical protein